MPTPSGSSRSSSTKSASPRSTPARYAKAASDRNPAPRSTTKTSPPARRARCWRSGMSERQDANEEQRSWFERRDAEKLRQRLEQVSVVRGTLQSLVFYDLRVSASLRSSTSSDLGVLAFNHPFRG